MHLRQLAVDRKAVEDILSLSRHFELFTCDQRMVTVNRFKILMSAILYLIASLLSMSLLAVLAVIFAPATVDVFRQPKVVLGALSSRLGLTATQLGTALLVLIPVVAPFFIEATQRAFTFAIQRPAGDNKFGASQVPWNVPRDVRPPQNHYSTDGAFANSFPTTVTLTGARELE